LEEEIIPKERSLIDLNGYKSSRVRRISSKGRVQHGEEKIQGETY